MELNKKELQILGLLLEEHLNTIGTIVGPILNLGDGIQEYLGELEKLESKLREAL